MKFWNPCYRSENKKSSLLLRLCFYNFQQLNSYIVLLIWPLLKQSKLGKIPAPFIVLFLGMGLAQFFGIQHEHYHLGQAASHEHLISPPFLVDIPSDFSGYFYLPDFSKIDTFEFWIATITICMVASLESVLSATAAEKVDSYD